MNLLLFRVDEQSKVYSEFRDIRTEFKLGSAGEKKSKSTHL